MKTTVSLVLITGNVVDLADLTTAHIPASLTPATSCTATTSIPTCGVSCITSAASAVGCSATDYACPCHSSEAVFSSAEGCVVSACGSATASELFSAASTLCAVCS